jgi:protein phosphatase 2C family protein 2/3
MPTLIVALQAGGTVTMRRVNGDLAVSRALGDFVYKHMTDLKAEEQQVCNLHGSMDHSVSSLP